MAARSCLAKRKTLDRKKTWSKAVPHPDSNRKYTFELHGQDGTILLSQTEGKYDWTDDSNIELGPQPNYVIPSESVRTEDDWLQAGDDRELNGDKLSAMEIYAKALKMFPTSFELQKAQGRILCSLKRFEDAKSLLAAAHTLSTTDGEVSYYQGMALEGVGKDAEALDAYEAAMRSPEHRAAATLRIAEWDARHGKLEAGSTLVAKIPT